jgi:hypothetical protein
VHPADGDGGRDWQSFAEAVIAIINSLAPLFNKP